MIVQLNGSPQQILHAATVRELVTELELPAAAILIEHNGIALHRHEWPATPLNDGDRLEILRVVAGG